MSKNDIFEIFSLISENIDTEPIKLTEENSVLSDYELTPSEITKLQVILKATVDIAIKETKEELSRFEPTTDKLKLNDSKIYKITTEVLLHYAKSINEKCSDGMRLTKYEEKMLSYIVTLNNNTGNRLFNNLMGNISTDGQDKITVVVKIGEKKYGN